MFCNSWSWKGPHEITFSRPCAQIGVIHSSFLRALSDQVLNTPKNRDTAVSLDNKLKLSITLAMTMGFFLFVCFKWNFSYFSLCLLSLVLSLVTEQSVSIFLTSPLPRYLYILMKSSVFSSRAQQQAHVACETKSVPEGEIPSQTYSTLNSRGSILCEWLCPFSRLSKWWHSILGVLDLVWNCSISIIIS